MADYDVLTPDEVVTAKGYDVLSDSDIVDTKGRLDALAKKGFGKQGGDTRTFQQYDTSNAQAQRQLAPVADVAATVGSIPVNLGVQAASGLVGLVTQSPEAVKQVQADFSYTPKTEAGEAAGKVISWPFEQLAKGGAYLGNKIMEDQGTFPSANEAEAEENRKISNQMNPYGATVVDTAVNAIPFLLPMFKDGKAAVVDSDWYRKATIPERGLVLQTFDDALKSGVSEADLAKMNPTYFQEALKRRAATEGLTPENPVAEEMAQKTPTTQAVAEPVVSEPVVAPVETPVSVAPTEAIPIPAVDRIEAIRARLEAMRAKPAEHIPDIGIGKLDVSVDDAIKAASDEITAEEPITRIDRVPETVPSTVPVEQVITPAVEAAPLPASLPEVSLSDVPSAQAATVPLETVPATEPPKSLVEAQTGELLSPMTQKAKNIGKVANNASGESAASLEALNAQKSNKARGIKTVIIDSRTGKERPAIGVRPEDNPVNPFDVMVRRTPDGGQTILQQGAKAKPLPSVMAVKAASLGTSAVRKVVSPKVYTIPEEGAANAIIQGNKQASNQPEYPNGNSGGETPTSSGSDRPAYSAPEGANRYGKEEVKYETGKPIELSYIRNKEKSPNMGERFGQHIEPSGRYITERPSTFIGRDFPNMEEGKVSFKNPLVINWGGGYSEPTNWKQVLSNQYGDKKGRVLSKAIAKDGHDGIITMDDKGNTSEIVDLSSFHSSQVKPSNPKAIKRPVKTQYAIAEESNRTLTPESIKRVEGLISKALPAGKVSLNVVGKIKSPAKLNEAYAAHGLTEIKKIVGKHDSFYDFPTQQIKSIITLALDGATDKIGYHEVLHSGEALGLLSPKDIDIIARAYPDKDGVSSSERRADAFADYVENGTAPHGYVKILFDRIIAFIKRLAQLLKGEGWRSADDVFSDLMGGKLKEGLAKKTDTQLSATGARQPFYSKLSEVVNNKMSGKMFVPQLRSMLKNNGVSDDEITNVLGEFDENKSVTKTEIQEATKANGIKFDDIILRPASKAEKLAGPGDYPRTSFDQYTEPGAKEGSYREMFVTAPKIDSYTVEQIGRDFKIRKPDGTLMNGDYSARNMAAADAERLSNQSGVFNWQDGHSQYSDIQNPIVRTRFNDWETPQGKILMVEEMQGPSDANQQNMPEYLRKRIYDIGVKRVLAYAKENGYDGVAWTPGEMQAKRYDLSKHVSRVEYEETLSPEDYTPTGKYDVTVYDHQDNPIDTKYDQSPGQIAANIGKELADKIVKGEGVDEDGGVGFKAEGEPDTSRKVLSGLNLKVGGEGLKTLYDKTLPALFKKYGKESAQVVTLQIDSSPRSLAHFLDWAEEHGDKRPRPELGDAWSKGLEDKMVAKFMADQKGVQVPFVPVTTKTPSAFTQYALSKDAPPKVAAKYNKFLDDAESALNSGDTALAESMLGKAHDLETGWDKAPKGEKARRLAKNVANSALNAGIGSEIDFKEMPSYDVRHKNVEGVAELIESDYPRAKRIIEGDEPPPEGMFREEVYTALRKQAIDEGDINKIMDLMKSSMVSEATELGRRIQALDAGADELDPFNAMKDVIDTRLERARKISTTDKTVKEQAAEIESLKVELDKARAALDNKYSELAVKKIRKETERKAVRTADKKVLDTEFHGLATKLNSLLNKLSVNIDPSAIPIFVDMARNRIMAGIVSAPDIIESIHGEVSSIIKGVTKRDIQDAISGYGKTSEMSQDDIDVALRETKRQLKLLSALEDASRGKVPLKSGLERDQQSEEVRLLREEVKQAMKASGIDYKSALDPEAQWKTSLDAVKTRLRNDISDLDRQIEAGKRDPIKKTGVKYDTEALKLKEIRAAKQAILDSIDAKPGMTAQRKIEMAINALERSIEGYKRQIATSDFTKKPAVSTPETPEIKKLRDERDDLIKTRNEKRELKAEMEKAGGTDEDPNITALNKFMADTERQIKAREKALDKSIEEYQRKISENDIETDKKISATPEIPGTQRKKAVLSELKKTFEQMKKDAQPPKEPKTQDELDAIKLKSYKRRLLNEQKKYNDMLTTGEVVPPKKSIPVKLDEEGKKLKEEYDRSKENYRAALDVTGTVTKDEAAHILRLSKMAADAKGAIAEGGSRFEYGAARVAYENYVDSLKGYDAPVKVLIKNRVQEMRKTWQENKSRAIGDAAIDSIKTISNNSIAMVATLDNSFLLRQGLKVLLTHPSAWVPGAKASFVNFAKTVGGKNALDVLLADIYSRPNYLNGKYKTAKIVSTNEEQFPTSLPEHIPGVGRVFKASEVAFKGAALQMRTDLFDLYEKMAIKNGVDTSNKAWLEDIGKLINSLTARGKWGKTGEPAIVRIILWAPKMLKANIDVLTAHGFGYGLDHPWVKKQAAINLLKIISEMALIMAIANALLPGSAETDPRSSDIGKIKIGKTRFDYSGGMGSLLTLSARVITTLTNLAGITNMGNTKNTETGFITKYGTGFGKRTAFDAVTDFLVNKTTPPMGVLVQMLKGKNRDNTDFTFSKALYGSFTPISAQNFISMKDDVSADKVAGALVDLIGLNANSYMDDTPDARSIINKLREGKPLNEEQQTFYDSLSHEKKHNIQKASNETARIQAAKSMPIADLADMIENSPADVKSELKAVFRLKYLKAKDLTQEDKERYQTILRDLRDY